MKTLKEIKDVYLSIEQFNKDLEDCLTIITEPTKRNPYYVCEYVSPALYKSIVHVYIIKQIKNKSILIILKIALYLHQRYPYCFPIEQRAGLII